MTEIISVQKMEEALKTIDNVNTDDEPSRKNQSLVYLAEVGLQASIMHHNNTLDMVAKNKKLVEDSSMKNQASTILSWHREFLPLDSDRENTEGAEGTSQHDRHGDWLPQEPVGVVGWWAVELGVD